MSACVILAGGRSSRMGRPKAWLPMDDDGTPLLIHVATRVAPLVDEIVIVAAAAQELPDAGAALARRIAVRIVHDHTPDLGPLPALALGLTAVGSDTAFALSCDAPLVSHAVLALLDAELAEHDAVVPTWEGRLQPLVALYRRRVAPAVEALVAAGERRAQAVASLPGCLVLPEERARAVDPLGASFRPLNTPAEYLAARAMLAHDRDPSPRKRS